MSFSSENGLYSIAAGADNSELLLPAHGSLTYRDVKAAGPPAQPLDFPTPVVHRAAFFHGRAVDHRNGRLHNVKVVCTTSSATSDHQRTVIPLVGYWFKKTIERTVYGSVQLCVVLRRRHNLDFTGSTSAEWISTDELVAIKVSSWAKVRKTRGGFVEDPLREAACLQLVGNYHANVLGCLEVLQDDDYLYTVMPYCNGGDLCSFVGRQSSRRRRPTSQRAPLSPARTTATVAATSRSSSSSDKSAGTTPSTRSTSTPRSCVLVSATVPDESQARLWFRQLLAGLQHLQKKGVCHRDLSIANIMLEANNNLVIIDFGLALRVPYKDNSNYGCVSDVSEGSNRLLMKGQGYSGAMTYTAPEIVEGLAFDGFAADLWSAGVLLFVFLVGLVPFQAPTASDVRYNQINKGKLKELMEANLLEPVSDEACDLLQNMLWRDPRRRLTLNQVLQHPWVLGLPPTSQESSSPLQPNVANISPRSSGERMALKSAAAFPREVVATTLTFP